jgi:hypothetical protein
LFSVVPIKANIQYPECNGPFLIYDVPDMICVDGSVNECRGFFFLLPTDSRFTEMDDETNWYYLASVTSDGLGVLFKVPGWPFRMYPKGKFSRKLYDSVVGQVLTNVEKSMNNVHSFFDGDDPNVISKVEERNGSTTTSISATSLELVPFLPKKCIKMLVKVKLLTSMLCCSCFLGCKWQGYSGRRILGIPCWCLLWGKKDSATDNPEEQISTKACKSEEQH